VYLQGFRGRFRWRLRWIPYRSRLFR